VYRGGPLKKFIVSLLVLVLPFTSHASEGGEGVGNGGDGVLCTFSSGNQLEGLYSLDYLLEYRSVNPPVTVPDWRASFSRIKALIESKAPHLAESLNEFLQHILNEDERVRSPRVWQSIKHLEQLNDEGLDSHNGIPINCMQKGKPRIVQAVIREIRNTIVGEKIYYKFNRLALTFLRDTNPLQFSFLLIHEWLWDITSDVKTNRKLNYLFHSHAFDSITAEELAKELPAL
jgi:hypothetical protein